jgi:hypothetical protein
MSTNDENLISDESINEFCHGLMDAFHSARKQLATLHPDWSLQDVAGYLMEFGRAQISQSETPEPSDLEFISSYVSSLRFDNPSSSLYCAFAAGCLMGFVKTGHLPMEQYVHALELSTEIAQTELA